jgi:hypothetical protein
VSCSDKVFRFGGGGKWLYVSETVFKAGFWMLFAGMTARLIGAEGGKGLWCTMVPGFDSSDGLGGGSPPPRRGGRPGRLSSVELIDCAALENPSCLGSRNGALRGAWVCSTWSGGGTDLILSETCLCEIFGTAKPVSRAVGLVETVFARTGIVVSVFVSCLGSNAENPSVLGSRLSTIVLGCEKPINRESVVGCPCGFTKSCTDPPCWLSGFDTGTCDLV